MAPKNKQNIGLGQFVKQGAMLYSSRVLPDSAAATFGQQKKEQDTETALRNGLLAGSEGAAQIVTKGKSKLKTKKATQKETADDEATTTTAGAQGAAKGRRKAKKGDKDQNAADDKDDTAISAAASITAQANIAQRKKTIKFIPRHINPSTTKWGHDAIERAEKSAPRATAIAYPTDKMTIAKVDGVLTTIVIKSTLKQPVERTGPHNATVGRQHGGRHVIVAPRSSARGRKSKKELVGNPFSESDDDDDVEVYSHDEADNSQSSSVNQAHQKKAIGLATTQRTPSAMRKQKPSQLAESSLELDDSSEDDNNLEESEVDQAAISTKVTKQLNHQGTRTRPQHRVSFALSSDDEDVTPTYHRRASTMSQNLIQICEDGDETNTNSPSNNSQPTSILRSTQPKSSPSLSKENQDLDSPDDLSTAIITNSTPARKPTDSARKKGVARKPEPKRARVIPPQSEEDEEPLLPPSKRAKTTPEAAEPKKAGPARKKGVARAVAKPKQKARVVMEEVTDESDS